MSPQPTPSLAMAHNDINTAAGAKDSSTLTPITVIAETPSSVPGGHNSQSTETTASLGSPTRPPTRRALERKKAKQREEETKRTMNSAKAKYVFKGVFESCFEVNAAIEFVGKIINDIGYGYPSKLEQLTGNEANRFRLLPYVRIRRAMAGSPNFLDISVTEDFYTEISQKLEDTEYKWLLQHITISEEQKYIADTRIIARDVMNFVGISTRDGFGTLGSESIATYDVGELVELRLGITAGHTVYGEKNTLLLEIDDTTMEV
jgi:hypothetical protein